MICVKCGGSDIEVRKDEIIKLLNGNVLYVDEYICQGCGYIHCDNTNGCPDSVSAYIEDKYTPYKKMKKGFIDRFGWG